MSLVLDLNAIRERFIDQWDDEVLTLFENGDSVDPNEAEPYVRFSINPGNRALIGGGQFYSQLGRVWLQIFIPPGEGQIMGMEIADRFCTMFRNWKSDDGCVRTYGEGDVVSIPSGENQTYQINVSVAWEAKRHL